MIQEYASYLLRPDYIASLLDLDAKSLKADIRNPSNEAHRYYEKGKAQTILELRQQEIRLAKLGSPLAVELTSKYLIDQQMNER